MADDLEALEQAEQELAARIAAARAARVAQPIEAEPHVRVQGAPIGEGGSEPALSIPEHVWRELTGETAAEPEPEPQPQRLGPSRRVVSGGNLGRRGSFRRPPVLAPQEEPPEPRKPQPTCRFFAPNAATAIESGAEAGPDWPFDRVHPTAMGCCQPDLNAAGNTQCAYWEHQEDCNYYEASQPVAFRRRKLTKASDEGTETTILTLAGRRWEQGTPRFAILAGPEGGQPSVLGEVTEPGPDIRARAEAAYDNLQGQYGADSVEELSVADKTQAQHSYLRSLVEA